MIKISCTAITFATGRFVRINGTPNESEQNSNNKQLTENDDNGHIQIGNTFP